MSICQAITKSGKHCSYKAKANGLCGVHKKNHKVARNQELIDGFKMVGDDCIDIINDYWRDLGIIEHKKKLKLTQQKILSKKLQINDGERTHNETVVMCECGNNPSGGWEIHRLINRKHSLESSRARWCEPCIAAHYEERRLWRLAHPEYNYYNEF